MTKVTVNLNQLEMMKRFVSIISTFESDVDAVRDKYTIDAKSIMGLLTLDLSKPLDIVLNSKDEDEVNRFLEVMKEFE